MNLNKITLSLIFIFFIFAIFCSINIGMSWDEPQRHWQGAIRTIYLKSFEFGKFEFKPGGWSEIEPGLYDAFSFLISDLFLKIFPYKTHCLLLKLKQVLKKNFYFLYNLS